MSCAALCLLVCRHLLFRISFRARYFRREFFSSRRMWARVALQARGAGERAAEGRWRASVSIFFVPHPMVVFFLRSAPFLPPLLYFLRSPVRFYLTRAARFPFCCSGRLIYKYKKMCGTIFSPCVVFGRRAWASAACAPRTRVLPRPNERVVASVATRRLRLPVQEYKTILDRSHRRNQDGTAEHAGHAVTASAAPSRWE